MGLDQWTIKVTRIPKKEADKCNGMDLSEVRVKHWMLRFDADDLDSITDVIPYLRFIRVYDEQLNYERIRALNNVSSRYKKLCSRELKGGVYTFTFRADKASDTVSVSVNEKDLHVYCDKVKIRVGICDIEHVDYWRKCYDLQDAIYDLYRMCCGTEIQNCGWYAMDEAMVDVAVQYANSGVSRDDYEYDERDSCIVYHECY